MRRCGALGFLAFWLSGLALGADIERIQKLIAEAREAESRQDLDSAIQLYNQAVALSPTNVELRLARALFLQGSLGLVHDPKLIEQVTHVTRSELGWVSENSPDTRLGGMARDALAALDGRAWFPAAEPNTPTLAQKHAVEALSLLEAGSALEAYQQAVEAVIEDPGYEAGWSALREATERLDGRFLRRYSAKPVLEPRGEDYHIASLPREIPEDSGSWLAYGMSKITFWTDPASKASGKNATPLDAERFAVRQAISTFRENPAPPAQDTFWSLMSSAEKAGFLDEAIGLLLLDEKLVPEYKSYRKAHRERLERFLKSQIAPLPNKTGDSP